MFRKTLAPALSALMLALPAQALDLSAMSEAERTAFRAEVRAYLLENPEVLQEAIEVLNKRYEEDARAEAKEDSDLVRVNAAELFEDDHSWVGGNPDGDVTIVEFVDYRCGYCRKASDEVAKLIKSDSNIRLILKEFPILSEDSSQSARFAIAALHVGGKDAYKAAHDRLMTLRGHASDENLSRLAEDLGLDAKAVLAAMNTPRVDEILEENYALAQRLRISGTPTFVVGDQMLRGYVPLEGMQQIVAKVREAG